MRHKGIVRKAKEAKKETGNRRDVVVAYTGQNYRRPWRTKQPGGPVTTRHVDPEDLKPCE